MLVLSRGLGGKGTVGLGLLLRASDFWQFKDLALGGAQLGLFGVGRGGRLDFGRWRAGLGGEERGGEGGDREAGHQEEGGEFHRWSGNGLEEVHR